MASVTPSVNARMLSPGSRETWHEGYAKPSETPRGSPATSVLIACATVRVARC
jgi:hypothetical protein